MTMNIRKAQVRSTSDLPQSVMREIERTTVAILGTWRRTVAGIIEIGRSLDRLREIMPRPLYLEHLQTRLCMSEMQSHRLIQVHRRFGNGRSAKILQARPSVLYLLASNADPKKVEQLASGAKVKVGGTVKSIDQLKVGDAVKLRIQSKPTEREPTAVQIDRARAETAHRELGTLIEKIDDWCADLRRFKNKNLEIRDVDLIAEYLRECRQSIERTIKILK